MLVPSYVTRIVLNFVESSQIEFLSIQSESMQLSSELISVIVTSKECCITALYTGLLIFINLEIKLSPIANDCSTIKT